MLRLAGVESYFSGCLTLTLERPRVARDGNLIVLNDVPDEVPGFVRAQTSKRIVTTTHSAGGELQAQNRFAMAQSLLALYARASCVVTARLHCAMPCIAIGTPVLFLAAAADKYRFSGLAEMAHSCSPEEFTSGRFRYDINSPPANKTLHLPYRASLKKTAMDFVNQADHGNGRGWYPLSERERRIPEKMAAAVAGSPCASDPWAQA
jgi:hypothetical protein